MSATESMLKAWRELVEPAVTGERDLAEFYLPPERRPLPEGDFGGDEEPTWPGVDRLPTVEKGESDADEQC